MINIAAGMFISGVFFGSGPCVASCGPVLISYVAGTKRNILAGLRVYAIFSASRILVYCILSVLIFIFGSVTLEHSLDRYYPYLIFLAGVFLIMMGILMVLGQRLEYRVCQFLGKNFLERDTKSVILMGLVMGLAPCAPLLGILSYIGLVSKSWLSSLLYGFLFGVGTSISPLIILTVLAAWLPQSLSSKQLNYSRIFNIICGIILVFLGAALIRRLL